MPKIHGAKWVVGVGLPLCLGAFALAWWLLRDPVPPYTLRDTPSVQVAVRPVDSACPEAEEVAREAELIIKVYVQRLRAGDAADLARIGAPWYTGRQRAAQDLISAYGTQAGSPVEAVVSDPVAPGLASVELRFTGGRRQVLDLTQDDDVWWLALGDGDPVHP